MGEGRYEQVEIIQGWSMIKRKFLVFLFFFFWYVINYYRDSLSMENRDTREDPLHPLFIFLLFLK